MARRGCRFLGKYVLDAGAGILTSGLQRKLFKIKCYIVFIGVVENNEAIQTTLCATL
jgi:hypothetical protein